MPSLVKKQYVDELAEKLAQNPHFCLVDFDSLTHQQIEELRRSLRPIVIKILKNSLYKVALQKFALNRNLSGEISEKMIQDDIIKGPSALLSLGSDWLSGLQSFWKFVVKYEGMAFKVGLLDSRVYDRTELEKLAQLPTREVLIGKILGSFQAPQSRTVMSLKYAMSKLVYILKSKAN